jgi:hypothetical protein
MQAPCTDFGGMVVAMNFEEQRIIDYERFGACITVAVVGVITGADRNRRVIFEILEARLLQRNVSLS